MTKNIVISGERLTGKTMVAVAIASKLKSMGKDVGYFKPVGRFHDDDAAVMKEYLDLESSLDCMSPIAHTKSDFDEFLQIGYESLTERLDTCYAEIALNKDYVIIEGTRNPWEMLHVNLSTPQIAHKFNAYVVCLVNFTDVTAIDNVLMLRDLFRQHGNEEIGIVLNMVPPMLKTIVIEKIKPFLEENGVSFLGKIIHKRELFSPTIHEILKALNGQIITGEDKMDLLIDQFMIGSMAPENALKWFRRAKDKAVITSGDRADICQAALETDTNLLILAGGMGPDIGTIARAKEQGVPIMMTAHDTYTTGQIVDGLIGTLTPENKEKVAIVEKTIGEALDLGKIGIKK